MYFQSVTVIYDLYLWIWSDCHSSEVHSLKNKPRSIIIICHSFQYNIWCHLRMPGYVGDVGKGRGPVGPEEALWLDKWVLGEHNVDVSLDNECTERTRGKKWNETKTPETLQSAVSEPITAGHVITSANHRPYLGYITDGTHLFLELLL